MTQRQGTAVDTQKPDSLVLPDDLNGWALTEFTTEQRSRSSIFGEHSRIWTYRAPVGDVRISFDYPFGSWHDLRVCYEGTGWSIVSTNSHSCRVAGGPSIEFLDVEMKRSDGQVGYLVFGEFENTGRPVDPMTLTDGSGLPLVSYLQRGLKDRWAKRMVDFGVPIRTYQLQMLSVSHANSSPYERTVIVDQFKSALGLAYSAVVKGVD